MPGNPYHIYCGFFDRQPPAAPSSLTFKIIPAPFAAHICRNIGMPLFRYEVISDGKVVNVGKGKTEEHATKTAKKIIKLRTAAHDEAVRRWKMTPGAFWDHPIMVAARAKCDIAEAAQLLLSTEEQEHLIKTNQTAHDIWMRESGYYYWKPDTQFVPGMGAGHYE